MTSSNSSPAPLRNIAPGVHVTEAHQRFFGIEVGARMTVLELEGGLLIHSPVAIDPNSVAHLGTPRWIIAPNLLHHLYVGPWADAGAEAWGVPGLPEKRSDLEFAGVFDSSSHPFGDEIQVLPMTCSAQTNEVVVLHRPSRTLIVCDLLFNFSAAAPWFTRFAMRCMGGYPGCRTTVLERMTFRRDAARKEVGELAGWDFDRLIMAHGDVIDRGGKEAMRGAFGWLNMQLPGQ